MWGLKPLLRVAKKFGYKTPREKEAAEIERATLLAQDAERYEQATLAESNAKVEAERVVVEKAASQVREVIATAKQGGKRFIIIKRDVFLAGDVLAAVGNEDGAIVNISFFNYEMPHQIPPGGKYLRANAALITLALPRA